VNVSIPQGDITRLEGIEGLHLGLELIPLGKYTRVAYWEVMKDRMRHFEDSQIFKFPLLEAILGQNLKLVLQDILFEHTILSSHKDSVGFSKSSEIPTLNSLWEVAVAHKLLIWPQSVGGIYEEFQDI
jgi:hypothetical protein